ncbi:OLC1v1017798C1 [Oldenlandia corymbosa var. corymbosa]|uniref:Gamma-tubulin complex component n=1 Tax=Oldenlandia corymbosa var. corymbosa TaxID=529605 RepID=A0AAV1EAD2_OLDCO|nr:OLC1v1017798C1 [Oldenlandia corymbosa var. corymbosa]
MAISDCFIGKVYSSFSNDGLQFAAPLSSLRVNEIELVKGVLHICQGFSSFLFYWDENGQCYGVKSGIYVSHLTQTSLRGILAQFVHAATCLKSVEIILNKIEKASVAPPPTLRAFTCSVSAWLRKLRDFALREEEKISTSDDKTVPTLLGLSNSLSSLCSGAECLMQIVNDSVPGIYFELNHSVAAADIATHILNQLYRKLNEICLLQGGEEDSYKMLLYIFTGTILPYIEVLDSWLFEGTLDDPVGEMFFYANKTIAIDETDFWEKSYLLRSKTYEKLDRHASPSDVILTLKEKKDMTRRESSSSREIEGKDGEYHVCPLFIKEMGKAIVSAGKSLQLIRHAPLKSFLESHTYRHEIGRCVAGLTLSEAFCVSLAALIGCGDHIADYVWHDNLIFTSSESHGGKCKEQGNDVILPSISSDKVWNKFLAVTLQQKRRGDLGFTHRKTSPSNLDKGNVMSDAFYDIPCVEAFCPENPTMTVCQKLLQKEKDSWSALSLSRNMHLPPLDDEELRNAVFDRTEGSGLGERSTNFRFGFGFDKSEFHRQKEETKMLEMLFPFPTLLPSFQEDLCISEFLPFEKNSTLSSRTLNWIQGVEPKITPLPVVIMQECLLTYIKKQADYIGRNILTKLLHDWRLLDELGVLRAIYLLGSGDLLQHFLLVVFNKLDKGEALDDDFELNTILQESVRNSADGSLLSSPDSLVVSVSKSVDKSEDEQYGAAVPASTPRRSRLQTAGIDVLQSLTFTYKVSWPLELLANAEALKKYNQVMVFLLKVRRAKFVLDKARRWMLKDRSTATTTRKHHWLLEQKLLHFVDAFHQYVMDRVYHSAWRELCEGVAAARSLDEVIEVHESYLLSIQRQCFVVPDKLWALIANRLNNILGLALDFYAVQQTLSSGGAMSAVKARCEMEIDRIEKQFDDCITFLLRILSFKLNVGQFPHLADLVTRLNYNYFYMSDSGSLVTSAGSETISSKIGKTF